MPRLSLATHSRVVAMWQAGFQPMNIQLRLQEEGVIVSKKSLWALISKYIYTGSVADYRPLAPRRKLKDKHYRCIDGWMAADPELSITKLYRLFQQKFPHVPVSESTVKRARRELGWVAKKTRYCALISDKNQLARLDVIFTDECTVQLESYRLITFRKPGQVVQYRMKPKHPHKLSYSGGSHGLQAY